MLYCHLVRNSALARQLVRSYAGRSSSASGGFIKENSHVSNQNGGSFNDRSSVHVGKNISKTVESRDDSRLSSYSGSGHVNLHGVTQSTVPKPFQPPQKNSAEKNAIGIGSSAAGQAQKFVSNSIKDTHQSKNYSTSTKNGIGLQSSQKLRLLAACYALPVNLLTSTGLTPPPMRCMSTQSKPSQKDKLKSAVKDYGSTVIVFHVAISLMSLGGFYLAVSSGLDMTKLLSTIGASESLVTNNMATGASTFVVAYAVHKVFAPVRIAITLSATPFIVRYLRRIGILSKKVNK